MKLGIFELEIQKIFKSDRMIRIFTIHSGITTSGYLFQNILTLKAGQISILSYRIDQITGRIFMLTHRWKDDLISGQSLVLVTMVHTR